MQLLYKVSSCATCEHKREYPTNDWITRELNHFFHPPKGVQINNIKANACVNRCVESCNENGGRNCNRTTYKGVNLIK